MKNRTITIALFFISILLVITIHFLQNGVIRDDKSMFKQLNDISRCAQHKEWSKAQKKADELLETWNKAKFLIAVNYAEGDYSLFLDSISRLKEAIKIKDKTETVCQTRAAAVLLDNFLKFCPQP